MRLTKAQGKEARRAIRAAGYSVAQTARTARVSRRMAKYWYDGEKSSPRCASAHRMLTGQVFELVRRPRYRVPA
jgi:hypothetical protein